MFSTSPYGGNPKFEYVSPDEGIFSGLKKGIKGINQDTSNDEVIEMYKNLTAVKNNPQLKKHLFEILLPHMRERQLLIVPLDNKEKTLVILIDVSGSMNSCCPEEIIRYLLSLYQSYEGQRIVIVPFGMPKTSPIYRIIEPDCNLDLFIRQLIMVDVITGRMIDQCESEELRFMKEYKMYSKKSHYLTRTSADNLKNLPKILEDIPKSEAIQLAIISDGMIDSEGRESGADILKRIINSIDENIKVRFLPIILVITSSLYSFNHGSNEAIREYFAKMPMLMVAFAEGNLLGARMISSVEKYDNIFSVRSSYRARKPQKVEEELREVMEETTSLTPGKSGFSALGKWGIATICTQLDLVRLPEEVINSLLKALIYLIENTMSEHLRSMASNKEHPFQKMFRLVILRNRKGCPLSKKILNVLSLRGSSDGNIRRMLEEAKRVPREELDEMLEKVSRYIGTISPKLSSTDARNILNAVYGGMLSRVSSCFGEDGKWGDMNHDQFLTFMKLFIFILADENNLLNGWRLVELAYVLVTRLEPGTATGIPEALHRRLILFLTEFDFGSLFPQEIEDIIQVPELGNNNIQSLIARINNPSIPKEIVAISRRFFLLKKLRVVLLNHYWLRCRGKAKVEKIILKNMNGNPLELVLLAGTPDNGVYSPRCLIDSEGNLTACDFCFDNERKGQINALFEVTIQLVSQIRKNLREQAEDPNSFQGTSEDGFRKLYGSILVRLEKFFAGDVMLVEETVEMSAHLKGLKLISGLIKNLSPEIRRDWKKLARIMKSGKFSFHDLVSLRDFDIQEFILSLRTTLPVTLDKVKGDHKGALMGSYLFSPEVVNEALILLAEVRPMQMLSSIIDDYDVCCICMSNAKNTSENTTPCCGQIYCLSCQHNQARKVLEDEEIRPTVCPLCRNHVRLNPPTELIPEMDDREKKLGEFFSSNPELLEVWQNGSTPIGTCQNHGNLCVGSAACGRQTVYHCKRCIEELQVGEDVKHCPHCGIPYERIDGCNVMVCGSCEGVFCHQCGHTFQSERHAYSCGHYPDNDSFSNCKGLGVEDDYSDDELSDDGRFDDGYYSDW